MALIFVGVMGAPYESELCTTVLRFAQEAITRGDYLQVWTCGGATSLTVKALGDTKPRNPIEIVNGKDDARYPSTAALVRDLIGSAQGRLEWLVCRHCMEERGCTEQIDAVKVQPPFKFVQHMNRADRSLVLGMK